MDLRAPVVMFAAATLLTGCGGGQSNTSSPTPSASSASVNTADVAYLAAVRPKVQGSTDADLISLGHKACTDLEDADPLYIAGQLQDAGFNADAATAIPYGAAQAYCPQYKDKFPTP